MIRIYSFTSGRPEFLAYQQATLRSFLAEDHELIVISDAQDEDSARAIELAASAAHLRCERVEPAIPEGDPSRGLACAMEFAVREFVRYDDDLSLLVHADVFACRPLSLAALFDGVDVVAHPECKVSADGRTTIVYPWSGVIGLRAPAIADPKSISFAPGTVQGVGVDAGGMFWHYLERQRSLRVGALDKSGPVCAANGNLHLVPDVGVPAPEDRGVELVGDAFVHYLAGSGWFGEGTAYHRAKTAWLFALLDGLMSGQLAMPVAAKPPTSSWPGRPGR